MDISLLILTYNREEYLGYTLKSICQQDTVGICYEVVVVDDGSTDGTGQMVKEYQQRIPNLKYIYHKHDGVNIAECRNIALRNATGNIVCFLDSGVVLRYDFIKQHHSMHRKINAPDVVIGRVVAFEVCLGNNEFEQNFVPDQIQESIQRIASIEQFEDRRMLTYEYFGKTFRKMPVPWHFFWTCNVSWDRTGKLRNTWFDEQIRNWGMEDVELGYRLYQKGASFEFHVDALAIHLPHDTEQDVKDKFMNDGKNLTYFFEKHQNAVTEIYAYGRMYVQNEYMDYFYRMSNKRLTLEQIATTGLEKENGIIFGGGQFCGLDSFSSTVIVDYDKKYSEVNHKKYIEGIGAYTGFSDSSFAYSVIWDYWKILNNDLLWCITKEALRISRNIFVLLEIRKKNQEIQMEVSEEQKIGLFDMLLIFRKKFKLVEIMLEDGEKLTYVRTF